MFDLGVPSFLTGVCSPWVVLQGKLSQQGDIGAGAGLGRVKIYKLYFIIIKNLHSSKPAP